jgi:predicted RNA binding protein YcfA (HicA-like mRNA interferase family)
VPSYGSAPRRRLIRYLREFGFDGPFVGGNHEYMRRTDGVKVIIPNPHGCDIDKGLLGRILRQAGISREEGEDR